MCPRADCTDVVCPLFYFQKRGMTALHHAVEQDNLELFKFLIARGEAPYH